MLSLITHAPGAGAEIIRVLIAHPFIRKINFTGSTSVGRIIAEMAGRYLKPVLLELGGKCAAILCEDADLVAAARGGGGGGEYARKFHLPSLSFSIYFYVLKYRV